LDLIGFKEITAELGKRIKTRKIKTHKKTNFKVE